MKEFNTDGKRKQKNPTTNYAKDKHKVFCERCYKYNCGCPATKSKRKAPDCTL